MFPELGVPVPRTRALRVTGLQGWVLRESFFSCLAPFSVTVCGWCGGTPRLQTPSVPYYTRDPLLPTTPLLWNNMTTRPGRRSQEENSHALDWLARGG